MYCKICGTEVGDNELFCNKCGVSLATLIYEKHEEKKMMILILKKK